MYPTVPGVHLNGALWRRDIDRVVLSIGLLGARVAEKAAVRIWVTVHHNYLIQPSPPPPPAPACSEKREEKKEETDLKRESHINHLSLQKIRPRLNWNHSLEEPQFETPTVWEPVKYFAIKQISHFWTLMSPFSPKWTIVWHNAWNFDGDFTRRSCWQLRAAAEASQTKWLSKTFS